MKKPSLLLLGLALVSLTGSLHAQSGCVDSPENPTALLAVVGSAGAFFFSRKLRIK